MSLPGEFFRRLQMLVSKRRFQAELDEEIRLHLELRQQERVDAGVAISSARSAAIRRFGNPTRIKERSYMNWGWHWLESLAQDVRYGLRSLLRSPA